MARSRKAPTTPRHILIYDEDWEFLKTLYGPDGVHPAVGLGEAVRDLLHINCKQLRALREAQRDAELRGTGASNG